MLYAVGGKEGVLRCGLVRVVLLWWGGPLCWHVLPGESKMDSKGQRCRGTDSYRRTTSILNRPAAFGLWCVCEGLSCWMSVRSKKGLFVHAPVGPPQTRRPLAEQKRAWHR